MRGVFRHPASLVVFGLIIGLMLSPAASQAAGSIGKLFNQLKPKMDARYVRSAHEAYAFVDPNGPALDPSRTKGFSAVSRTIDGDYCLTPEASIGDIDNRVFVASPEYQSTSGSKADVFWVDTTNNTNCADGLLEMKTFVDGTQVDTIAFSVASPPS